LAPSSLAIKVTSILGASAVIFLLDWFYLNFTLLKGLDSVTQTFLLGNVSIPIPLQWLPVFGVVLLSLVTWYEAYYRIFPRRGLEMDPLGRLRLARSIVFSLTLFVLVLYVPSLIRSSWFWTGLSEAGRSVTPLRNFGSSLLNGVDSLFKTNLLWQYSLSQILASALMVIGALAFGRVTRRPRK
jgi:hypothetical protein